MLKSLKSFELLTAPFWIMHIFSVKSPLGLVLYCYLNMPTINTTYLILSYLHCQDVIRYATSIEI